MPDILFLEISTPPCESDLSFLFNLLSYRVASISHRVMPTFDEHKAFVTHHPYAKWFVIWCDGLRVGTLYIGLDNSVGFQMDPAHEQNSENVIRSFERNFLPLPEIKSLRSKHFFFNVAPDDVYKIRLLKKIGYQVSQISLQKA